MFVLNDSSKEIDDKRKSISILFFFYLVSRKHYKDGKREGKIISNKDSRSIPSRKCFFLLSACVCVCNIDC